MAPDKPKVTVTTQLLHSASPLCYRDYPHTVRPHVEHVTIDEWREYYPDGWAACETVRTKYPLGHPVALFHLNLVNRD